MNKLIVLLLCFVSFNTFGSELALSRLVSRALSSSAGVNTLARFLGVPKASISTYSEADIVRKLRSSDSFDELMFKRELDSFTSKKSLMETIKASESDFVTDLVVNGKVPQARMERFLSTALQITRDSGKSILGETFGTCMKEFKSVANIKNIMSIVEAGGGKSAPAKIFNSMLIKTQLVLTKSKSESKRILCLLAGGKCRVFGELVREQCL